MTGGRSPAAGVPILEKGLPLRLALAVLALAAFLVAPTIAEADHNSLQLVSTGANGGSGSYSEFDAVSQNDSTVVFSTTDQLVPADTDNQVDIYARTGTTTTLVSTGPNGGNGAFPATFGGASADASRIFFTTGEQLVSADTDNSQDVYEYSNGTTTLISTGTTGGNGAYDAYFVGSSQDGSRRWFQTSEQLTSADTDSSQDVYQRLGGTTTLMSTGPTGGNGSYPADFAGASADGTHVFFHTNEPLTSADTDSSQDVYDRSAGTTTLLSVGTTGGNGAFDASFEGASSDGTKVFFGTVEPLTSGDTDNQQDIYQRSGGTTTLLSTGSSGGNGNGRVNFVGCSADGSHVFFETQERLVPADNDGFIDVYDHTSSGTALISPGLGDNQGATNAYFAGASSDGSTVFIRTDESLTSADTDGYQDIYQVSGGVTTLLSVGPAGGNAAVNVRFDGVSPDGSDVFFETYESLVSGDTDSTYDVYERTNGTTTLLSQGTTGGNGPFDAHFAGMSQDGKRVFFRTTESLLSGDGDTADDLYSADVPGKVVVVKDAQPDDPQDFTFTIGGGLSLGLTAPPGQSTFALDDDSDPTLSNTQTIDNVAPGTGYSVTETVPGGWDQTGASCDNGSPPSNISVSTGQTVTCTFTNQKRGSITIIKDAQPDSPQDFNFIAGGGLSPSSFKLDDDNNPTLSNTRTFTNVLPHAGYSVSETALTSYSTSTSCDDGSPVSNIDVGPGENVTCTFTNKRLGNIVVVKDALPNDPQDFSFTAGGGLSPSSFSLDDDSDPTLSNTQNFNGLVPGSGYSVSEAAQSGWDQSSATCDNGSPVSNISVAAGQTVTCTFTNEKRGRIVVVKSAQPQDPKAFSFTAGGGLSPSSFKLDDNSDPTYSNTQTFDNVVPGTGYSLSESVPPGWDQSAASCDDGSPINNIDVSSGETVTCTFTNVKRASITVVKDAQPNDPQDFSFTAGGGLSPSSFSLDDDSDPTLSNSQTFTDVQPGSGYSVAETVPDGWDQTSATCSDGSPVTNITMNPGEAITCTFTNQKRGKIVVVKDAIPDDPQDFDFTAGGGLSPSSFQLDDDSDPTLSNTQVFDNVVPGSGYSISESPPAPWTQADATCDNGSPVTNINVGAGETVTCTFVNSRGGYARPKGATPYRAALVIAYQNCTSGNRTHGLPLIGPSCNPPVQSSNYLTVGTLDANGMQPNFSGKLRLDVKQGNPSTPENEADVKITFNTSDVRNVSDLSDYSGELNAGFDFQLTDKQNGPSQTENGTTEPLHFSMTVPCVTTSTSSAGSDCNTLSSVNALVPGAVLENKRAIWQMSDVEVFDGGADGVASTTPNTLFARQGIFIP